MKENTHTYIFLSELKCAGFLEKLFKWGLIVGDLLVDKKKNIYTIL